MQELIEKLQKDNGLNEQQAKAVLKTITEYVKDKFPMIGGAVDSLFQSGPADTDIE
jgi:hypothetical protein